MKHGWEASIQRSCFSGITLSRKDHILHWYSVTAQYCVAKWTLLFYAGYGGGGSVCKSCLTLATPWTIACQAPLSMGFSGQEYWSGLPFPSLGDCPNPGVKPRSPALQILYWVDHQGSPFSYFTCNEKAFVVPVRFKSVIMSKGSGRVPLLCGLPYNLESTHGVQKVWDP